MKTIYITLTADKGFTAEVDGKNIEYAFKENGYCLVDTERDSTPFEVTFPDEYEGYEAIVYLKNSHGGHTHVELGKIENGKVTHYLPQEMVCGGYTLVEYAASLNTELTKWKSIPVPVAQTGIDFMRATFPTRQEYVDILEAEKAREEAEAARRMAENVRESNEKQRIKNEEYRYLNELDRVEAETERKEAEAQRIENETERVEAEEKRAEFYEHYDEELERLDGEITDETSAREKADSDLDARVEKLETADYSALTERLNNLDEAIKDETQARETAVQAVQDDLTDYEKATDARLDALENADYGELTKRLEDIDKAIETETQARTDADEELAGRVKAIEDDYLTSTDKEAIEGDISDALTEAKEYTDDKTKAVSDALTTYTGATDARLDTLEESLTYKMSIADVDALFEEA